MKRFFAQSTRSPRVWPWFAGLAVVVILLLHESLFTAKGLVPADGVLGCAPWRRMQPPPSNALLADQYMVFVPDHEFVHRQQHWPTLWNPDLCCGKPNLATIQSALLFPTNWLLIPFDAFTAAGWGALIKLCLAGWFMMLYLRLLGTSPPAAALGGLAFCLSGFMIVWLGHPHVNTAMWLPLALYFIEKSFRATETKSMWRAWAGLAFACGMMVLGGHPPTMIHVMIVAGLYFLIRAIPGKPRQVWIRAAWLGGALAAGLLLAAPQLLPYLEYYRLSSTDAASANITRWSTHLAPVEAIHFLLPNIFGNPAAGFQDLATLLKWDEADNFNERTGYAGIVPLFFALGAIFFRRDRFTMFYSALTVGSLLVIFGAPPFARIFRALPVLREINETRLLLVVGFSVATLAALGWDELRRRTQRERIAAAAGFCAVAGGVLLVFWVSCRAEVAGLDSAHRSFFRGQVVILVVGLIVVLVVAAGNRHWTAALAVGWTAFDLLWFGTGINPAIPRNLYYPATSGIDFLQQDHSVFRVLGDRFSLPANMAEVFGLQDARGSDFMTVRRYEELITGHAGDFSFYTSPRHMPAAAPLLNLKYLLSAREIPINTEVFELVHDKGMFIYRFKSYLERAIVVDDYEVQSDTNAILQRIAQGGFDPRSAVLLEDAPDIPPASPAISTTNSARIVSYEPDEVRAEASLAKPGFLLMFDTYFPGWVATVNGQPARVQRADYNFRAVALPAGKSDVVFAYRPMSWRIGKWLCGVALLVLVAALVGPGKRMKTA